ncbi:MAG: LysM peptidoglycan-binding domain-containing protein [Alphaproteobacteria bacterium]|nr:LysM peptidoglycan-binding domain-containing protein [Alphaproteobacteria bacterium]MCB9698473.1 LysM peptidoglycan-binding domain-containing protein [Alphaproteobacteria bacterium]
MEQGGRRSVRTGWRIRNLATRWAVLATTLFWTLACGAFQEEELPVAFGDPTFHTVQQSEDVVKIAAHYDVTVEDVLAWNGLNDDHLEDGQVLLIWPHVDVVHNEPLTVAELPAKVVGGLKRAVFGSPAPAPVLDPLVDDGVAGTDGEVRVVVDVPTVPVAGAGLLSVDMETSDVDLSAAAASGTQRSGGIGEGSGLSSRGGTLASGGQADDLQIQQAQMRDLGPKIPNTPVTPPRLSKPAAKRCLSGAAATVSEQGIVQERGLDTAQVNAGMKTITRVLPRCFPSGTEGRYQMIVEVNVGCDGLVRNVFTVSPGVVPQHVTSCIEQTLGYASFPAHALPAGQSFQVPLTFDF